MEISVSLKALLLELPAYIMLSVFILSTLACNQLTNEVHEEEAVAAANRQLDSLTKSTRILADYDEAEQVFLNYAAVINLMDIIPDTSDVKARSRLFFMNKLKVNGAPIEALKQGWLAVRIKDSQHDDGALFFRYQAYSSMAGIYEGLGFKDSSLYVQRLAVQEANGYTQKYLMAGPLNNLGIYLYQVGFLDSAMMCFNKADSILGAIARLPQDYALLRGSIRDNIATIFEDRQNFEEAAKLFAINAELYKNSTDTFRFQNALISLWNAEIELGHSKVASKLFQQVNQATECVDCSVELANEVYLEETKIKYFGLARALQNQMLASQRLVKLQEQQMKQEAMQHENSLSFMKFNAKRFNQLMNAERQAKQDEARKAELRLYISILGFGGVVFSTVFFVILYRQRGKLLYQKDALLINEQLLQAEKLKAEENERKVLELELEHKKKDLTDMALHLTTKQSWAKELDQRIKFIESLKGTKRSREFKALKDEIRHQVRVDNDIAVLLADMDKLNAAFYEQLNFQFPGLSKTDKKLCSFIRLKLSNTQIAQIQNINPESVRMSKHRLRTKLNLASEIDMEEFLQSL